MPPTMEDRSLNHWATREFFHFSKSPCAPLGFPCGSAGKESTHNAGDLGSIPGLGRSPGEEGKGYPLQYSALENSMDYIVHGVPNRWTQLSNFHFHENSPTTLSMVRVSEAVKEGRIYLKYVPLA